MKRILIFFKNPKYIKSEKINWNNFFSLFLVAFFISLFYSPIYLILNLIIEIPENKINLSPFYFFIGMVFLIPVIEEIIFRLILKPLKKNLILILFTTFIIIIISLIRKNYLILTISLFTVMVILFFLTKKRNIINLQYFIIKKFKWVFYFSCLLFGFIHISNYDLNTLNLLIITPLLITPKVILGGFLGYIRMQYGILYSIVFHSLLNLFPAIIHLVSEINFSY